MENKLESEVYPVITLYQPWATWIIRGWKTVETRTHNRFSSLDNKKILIHAGNGFDKTAKPNPYLNAEQFAKDELVYIHGSILGSAYVQYLGCLDPMESVNALIECKTLRYGLFLSNVNVFAEPIPVKGEMGIWYFDLIKKIKVRKS